MTKLNWKIRLKNKVFLTGFASLSLVFAQQVAKLAGYDIADAQVNEIMALVNTVLTILGLVGVIHDPTTSGIGDSERALEYKELK